MLRQKGGSITLRLNPDSLGHVKVHVSMEESRVSARFEAGNPQTRELLAQHADSLRQSLEERGLQVERIAIGAEAEPGGIKPGQAAHGERPGHDGSGLAGDGGHRDGRGQWHARRENAGPLPGPFVPVSESTDLVSESPTQHLATAYAGDDPGLLWLRIDAIA